jgi:hypothetical protein
MFLRAKRSKWPSYSHYREYRRTDTARSKNGSASSVPDANLAFSGYSMFGSAARNVSNGKNRCPKSCGRKGAAKGGAPGGCIILFCRRRMSITRCRMRTADRSSSLQVKALLLRLDPWAPLAGTEPSLSSQV